MNHLLIQSDPQGFYIHSDDGPIYYKSINELVEGKNNNSINNELAHKQTLLIYPVPNPVSELQNIIYKWRTEITDFENTISDMFKDILK